MKKADVLQIRKIYAIGNALGMTDPGDREDALHLLISGITGKDSVKKLTYREAAAVIDELSRRQGSYTPKQKEKADGARVSGGMTEGQKRKVWALVYDLEKITGKTEATAGERLCGAIEKELKLTAHTKDPFRFLDYKSGNKLIEVLKGYVKSARKGKAVTEDDKT